MRWEQGQWSEERVQASINATDAYRAIPYGRSQIGPTNRDEIAEYWEEFTSIESVGKRPDLLVLRINDYERLRGDIEALGDTTLRDDDELAEVLGAAVCGIEAENSLWVGEDMPDYGRETITRLNFVAPTVIVKEEDAPGLLEWQEHLKIPICVVHVFFDRGFVIRLDDIIERVEKVRKVEASEGEKAARELQKDLGMVIKSQSYPDSRTGTSATKTIYRTHHTRALEFGIVDPSDPPEALSNVIQEDNGRIMAYVRFKGGTLILTEEAHTLFDELARERGLGG